MGGKGSFPTGARPRSGDWPDEAAGDEGSLAVLVEGGELVSEASWRTRRVGELGEPAYEVGW